MLISDSSGIVKPRLGLEAVAGVFTNSVVAANPDGYIQVKIGTSVK